MRLPCLIFIGNSLLCRYEFSQPLSPIDFDLEGMGLKPQRSTAYFCAKCGEIWARIFIGDCPFSQPIFRPCEKHRADGRWEDRFAGSLLLGASGAGYFWQEQAPEEFWHYELRVLARNDGLW